MIKHKFDPKPSKFFLNTKSIAISLMLIVFMFFAVGADSIKDGDDIFSIIIGAGLFTIAVGFMIWAADLSRNFSKYLKH